MRDSVDAAGTRCSLTPWSDCRARRAATRAALLVSLQGVLDQLRDLLRDPIVHRLRQPEGVVECVHAREEPAGYPSKGYASTPFF